MTEESIVNDFQRFDATIDTLTVVLTEHRKELTSAKNVARTGVFVGIFGIMLAVLGVVVGFDGRDVAHDIVSNRTEARISSCIQTNVGIAGNREALISSILVFAQDPSHLNPQEQAIADAYRTVVESKLPYRDCSPAGIEIYYEDPPSDPAKK